MWRPNKRFCAGLWLAWLLAAGYALSAHAGLWQNGCPREYAALFDTSSWQGYECVAGYSFAARGVPAGAAQAVCIMRRATRQVLCFLHDASNGQAIGLQTTQALYQGSVAPQFVPLEDQDGFGLAYVFADGATEELSYIDDQEGNWYFYGRSRQARRGDAVDYSDIHAASAADRALPNILYVNQMKGNLLLHDNAPLQGQYPLALEEFSLARFPHALTTSLVDPFYPHQWPNDFIARRYLFSDNRRYPVFSGPGEQYYRAAQGKAVVDADGWIPVFGRDNGWILIQYGVGPGQMRLGYITPEARPKGAVIRNLGLRARNVQLLSDSPLTDDPFRSKTALRTVKAGETVSWLGTSEDWAYVETKLEQLPVRGFIYASSLGVPSDLGGISAYGGDDVSSIVSCAYAFEHYRVDLHVTLSRDKQQYVAVINAFVPDAWIEEAADTDRLSGYRLYENNLLLPAYGRQMAQPGQQTFFLSIPVTPQAAVLGLEPVFSQSGPHTEEMLVIDITQLAASPAPAP